MVPDRIGSYEVLGLLGEGGMGAVYRGRDPRFDREVAIKVLHDQFRRDPGVVERFKSEAVIQAKLNHPHIVSVLDFVADDHHLAMVMERVEGQPLDEVIRAARGPLAVDRAVRLMDQVLSAMAFAHKRGLVHRDIKPSNILIQHLEGQEYAKVTDFGIAKILGSEKVRTATGAKMGTLAYMSPEHVQSPKGVDSRSDIYSLGVVLCEMLTGRVPFDADSEYALMRLIVEQPVEAALDGRVPAWLRPVLARAMAKTPGARFGSCEEMAEALRGVPGHAPGVASPGVRVAAAAPSPPPPRPPTEPIPGASPSGLSAGVAWGAAIATVVVAVALVLVVQPRQAAEAERVRLQAEAQRQVEQERRRAEEDRARAIAEERRRSEAAVQQARAARQALEAERLRQAEEEGERSGPSASSRGGMGYVRIPAGTFQMGCVSGDTECDSDETRKTVTILRDFWMGTTEVTVGAYRSYGSPPSGNTNGDDHPVVNVTWNEAKAHCESQGGRLPTEEEWERAARGGREGSKYPWGNSISPDDANYSGTGGRDRWSRTSPVGGFAANGYGLHDMSGNVWEWTSSRYDSSKYVLRGGSWADDPGKLRASFRDRVLPSGLDVNRGFRCAWDAP